MCSAGKVGSCMGQLHLLGAKTQPTNIT